MIGKINKVLILFAVALVFVGSAFAQPSSPDYAACPNQTVQGNITWNNVGTTNYTVYPPPGSNPAAFFTVNGSNPFVFSHVGSSPAGSQTVVTYTVVGNGISGAGPVTGSFQFNLTVTPPAALNLTNTVYYCPGQTATIIAPSGGNYYNISSPCFNANNLAFPTINIPNLTAAHNCTYLVTSVGACTATGITTISVAPNTPITVSSTSNICEGGSALLTATLGGASNYQWVDQNQTFLANTPNYAINNAIPNQQGNYTVTVDFPHPSNAAVLCPRSAVVTLSVVPTSPISIATSPGTVVCQNGKISFNALTSLMPNGWTWSGPQSFAASVGNPTINPATPLNSGTYSVTALFTNNVITCSTSAAVTVSVVTVTSPIITMPASVCQSVTVNMSATAPGALSFSWFGPNSFTDNNAVTTLQNAQPNASGVYYLTVKYGIGTTLCPATSSAQLNVVPVNSVSVIPPAHVCQPADGYLQSSAIGATQYMWYGPNAFISPGPNAYVYSPTTASSGIYTVVATFNGGNVTCYNSNTVALAVSSALNFTLAPRQQVCYNTPVSVSGPTGATSYTWTSSNGFTSNSKDLNFPVSQPKHTGTYTLSVSLGQCVTAATTTLSILTPMAFTIAPQSRTVCARDTTYFEAGMTGGSQVYAYTWIPATFLESNVGPKKICVPEATTYYNVVAYDVTCPNYTISSAFQVYVEHAPTPVLDLTKIEDCAPFEQLYDSHTKSLGGITTYDFGGTKKYQGDSIRIALKEPGTYNLTIFTKGKNGCGASFPVPYPLIVDPRANPSILTEPTTPSTIDEITFIPSVQNGNVVDYYWMFKGGYPTVIDTAIKQVPGWDTSNVKNPVRKYDLPGKFQAMLVTTTDKGCIDTVAKVLNVIDNFKVFIPNTFSPNGDGLNDEYIIKGSGMKLENFSMQLLDRWGNELFFTKDINEGWDGKLKNGNDAKVDTYLYRIKVVGMNADGRREFTGFFNLIR